MKYFLLFLLCFDAIITVAQTEKKDSTMTVEEMSKMRQDPVSGLRSVFLQEILIPVGEGTAQSFSIQPVWPFRLGKKLKLITYTIIPIQKIPPLTETGSSESGLGNILFNGYFSPIKKEGKLSWGIGPAVQLPTRSNAALGSNRVSMGPSALLYYSSDKFTGGAVIQNFWSLGGEGTNKVNSFNFQYVAYYNLPKGWFVESNATILANWEIDKDNRWLVPLGGGPGKTFKIGESKLFYCAAVQMFYNVVKPEPVGSWETIFQLQIIF